MKHVIAPIGWLLLLGLVLLVHPATAQTLTLVDGETIQGRYMGGTQETIIFEVNGETHIFSITEVESLTFDYESVSAAEAQAAVTTITVPAGTVILVKMDQTIVTGRNKAGERFTATLEADIVADGFLLATRGTKFYGKIVESRKAGRLAGKASLQLTLTDVMIDNQLRPLITDSFGIEGERSGVLKKMAVGAAVGGIAAGSSGLNEGAAVGLASAAMTPGHQIQLPKGALIEFRLQNQRTISISN